MLQTHTSRRVFSRLLFSVSFTALFSSSVTASSILTRSDWGARPVEGKVLPHRPVRITLHHTGVQANEHRTLTEKMRELQAFSQRSETLADGSMKKAWADVPYHFYIDMHGELAEGRDLDFAGDTNTSYDPTGHIGIALEGNFNVHQPEISQVKTLIWLVRSLQKQFDIELGFIKAHRDFSPTDCPGHHLLLILPSVLAQVNP